MLYVLHDAIHAAIAELVKFVYNRSKGSVQGRQHIVCGSESHSIEL